MSGAHTIFASGEDSGFSTNPGESLNYQVHTDAPGNTHTYDHALARCSLHVSTVAVGYLNPEMLQRLRIFTGGGNGFWLHAKFVPGNVQNADQQQVVSVNDGSFALMPAPGTGPFAFGKNGSLQFAFWDVSINNWTYIGSPSNENLWSQEVLTDLDIVFVGTALCYINGQLVCVGSGCPSDIHNLDLGNLSRNGTFWSEIMVQDSPTFGKRLVTLPLSGTGEFNQWTNDWTYVDELIVDDDSFQEGVGSEGTLWTHTFTPPPGDYTIDSIVSEYRAKALTDGTPGNPKGFKLLVRTVDGTINIGPEIDPDPAHQIYDSYFRIDNSNPHTSAAWTFEDLGDGFNTGMLSVAVPP